MPLAVIPTSVISSSSYLCSFAVAADRDVGIDIIDRVFYRPAPPRCLRHPSSTVESHPARCQSGAVNQPAAHAPRQALPRAGSQLDRAKAEISEIIAGHKISCARTSSCAAWRSNSKVTSGSLAGPSDDDVDRRACCLLLSLATRADVGDEIAPAGWQKPSDKSKRCCRMLWIRATLQIKLTDGTDIRASCAQCQCLPAQFGIQRPRTHRMDISGRAHFDPHAVESGPLAVSVCAVLDAIHRHIGRFQPSGAQAALGFRWG